MSPEQLNGKDADARSDIFSFGCVLHVLLSGSRAFDGETAASVIGAVLHQEPAKLEMSPPLDSVIRICLAKDPADRFQTAHDLRIALHLSDDLSSLDRQPVTDPGRQRVRLWQGAAGVLAASLLAVGWLLLRRNQEPRIFTRLTIDAPTPLSDLTAGGSSISPDGRFLCFVAKAPVDRGLYLRPMNSLTGRLIAGAEGASRPFWSPDSKSIGYFAQGKLMRISLDGGSPAVITEVSDGRGASWNRDGVILYAGGRDSVIFRVPASGGTGIPITEFDKARGENAHCYPYFLPDGKHFLYFRRAAKDLRHSGAYLGRLDDPQRGKTDPLLVNTHHRPIYTVQGGVDYLVYIRDNNMWVQPFEFGRIAL